MSYNSGVIVLVISNHSSRYSLNCTPLSLITITNQGLSKGYQPQPWAEADNPNLDLDYSGYLKNLIQ